MYPSTHTLIADLDTETSKEAWDGVCIEFSQFANLSVDDVRRDLLAPVIEGSGSKVYFKAMSMHGVLDEQFAQFISQVMAHYEVEHTLYDDRRIEYFLRCPIASA